MPSLCYTDNSFHNRSAGKAENSCEDYVFVCGLPSNYTADNPCPNEVGIAYILKVFVSSEF